MRSASSRAMYCRFHSCASAYALFGSSRTCVIGKGSARSATGLSANSSLASNGGASGTSRRCGGGVPSACRVCGGFCVAGNIGRGAPGATRLPNSRRVRRVVFVLFLISVSKPQTDLQLPRRKLRRRPPEVVVAQIHDRIAEIDAVERVERIQPELRRCAGRHGEFLGE